MKEYLIILAVLVAALLIFKFPSPSLAAGGTEELWKKVSEAENNGLPQTAIDALKEIYKSAAAENRQAEALKALLKQIVLDCNIKGNKAEEKVKFLKEEIEKADERLKPEIGRAHV